MARELSYAMAIYGAELEAARAASETDAAKLGPPAAPDLRMPFAIRAVTRLTTVSAGGVTIILIVVGALSIREGSARSILFGAILIAVSVYVVSRVLRSRRDLRSIERPDD